MLVTTGKILGIHYLSIELHFSRSRLLIYVFHRADIFNTSKCLLLFCTYVVCMFVSSKKAISKKNIITDCIPMLFKLNFLSPFL